MTEDNIPTAAERLRRAAQGHCPECGSDFADHCEIAFEHGHEAAEASDGLRELLAAQLGTDPHEIVTKFTPLPGGKEAFLDMYAPMKRPRVLPEPTPTRKRSHGLSLALGGLLGLAGVVIVSAAGGFLVIDLLVKRAVMRAPWYQDGD